MKSYLVTLTPLEPYFLGGERTFHYGTPTTAPDTYFISSEKLPNQTALLGVLRYALLDKEGLLWYGGEPSGQRQLRSELVGESSFSVNAENSFGRIGEISPLFLRRGNVSYIRTPANYGIAEGGLSFE
ncbi:MAG: hypothetical protein LUH36_00100, partial [Oscillospiraceae bacterium]|nr:hypothetical protein [Oscillospiraceae bacterium]